jgi:hypothetical protein
MYNENYVDGSLHESDAVLASFSNIVQVIKHDIYMTVLKTIA